MLKENSLKFVKSFRLHDVSINLESAKIIQEMDWKYLKVLHLSQNDITNKLLVIILKAKWTRNL